MVTRFGECTLEEGAEDGTVGDSNAQPVISNIEEEDDQDISFEENPSAPIVDEVLPENMVAQEDSEEVISSITVEAPEEIVQESPEPVLEENVTVPEEDAIVVETNSSSGSAGLDI
jgi:hypothetical protein